MERSFISVPSKRVETLPHKLVNILHCLKLHFSTLKAGRDAAAGAWILATWISEKFQYPQSGSRRSRMASNDDDVCEFLFQYPQSGSRRCRLRLCIRTTCSNIYFSTLKAGRDAAALFSLFLTEKFLKFQYPQSGSRRCRTQPHHQFVTNGKLSVPSKRVETLPPRMYQTLRTY